MKTLILSNYSKNNKSVYDLTVHNHYQYCSQYNLDMINTISEYNPHNNFNQIINLFSIYDTVISIGTDVLFTNFGRDIRQFNDFDYPIVIQDEGTGTVNGDFIFFNKTKKYLELFNHIQELDKNSPSTQYTINQLVKRKEKQIKVLPPRTMQSICPFGNENNENIKDLLWQFGDFSLHAHHPGIYANIHKKIDSLNAFLNDR